MKIIPLILATLAVSFMEVSAQIIPVKDGDLYSFDFANVFFEVDASVGARISSFEVNGTQVLSTTRSDNYSWGSTFWPSPQADWTWSQWGNWPPPAIMDEQPYTGGIGDTTIILTSAVDDGPGLQ
ncbi:MAG TPA: hypothetical protein VE870_06795, partial [Bacteroidales bacterium]|nr:hypothetical protein [Bacteroidales bacterium]